MAQIVKLRRSSITGNKPSTAQLELGELAINTYDGKIYFERSGSEESIEEIIITNAKNTGSLSISGSSHYITGSLYLSGSLTLPSVIYDHNNSTGSTGQILKSTANGAEWADAPSGSSGTEGKSVVQQFSSATTWTFNHNLGEQYPVIEVYDSNNQVIIPSTITATSTSTTTITFAVAVAGRAVATVGGGLPTISGSYENYVLTVISGSAAWVSTNAITVATASYALTASYAENIIVSGTVSGVDAIDFDTTAAMAGAVGRLKWNATDGTLDLGMGNGNATLQLGQELYYPPVVNKAGVQLNQGTLVMVDPSQPAQGNRLRVVKAITDGTYSSQLIVGVLTEDIANNATGLATWFGYVRSLSLSAMKPSGETWYEGDLLYANPTTPGFLTKVAPSAPAHRSQIAAITSINGNNLTIMVRPTLGFHLTELHDVVTTNPSTGDFLVRNGGGYWINSKILSGSYTLSGSLSGGTYSGSFIGGFSGSFTGNGSGLTNIPASSVVGLNLNQISSGSAVASITPTQFSVNTNTVITGSLTVNSGSIVINSITTSTFEIAASVPAATYTAVFFDYVVKNGTNLRAGTVMSTWDGTNVVYTETTTQDLGSTSAITTGVRLLDGNVQLTVTPTSGTWTVKTMTRAI